MPKSKQFTISEQETLRFMGTNIEGSEHNSSLHIIKGKIKPNISRLTVLPVGSSTNFAMAYENFKGKKLLTLDFKYSSV